jgi:ABC-type lipoprotein release transport system permease subunit
MRVTNVDDGNRISYQVVGVARNAHTDDVRSQVVPRYYVSAEQPPHSPRSPTFMIRTATDSSSVMAGVREGIQEVDPALPIISAKSIQERLAPLTAQDRTTAQLAVVFGIVALVLAAIGLYGVLSYGVARRTGEIAVRIALGAQSRGVIAMILRETMAVLFAGLAVGGVLAYAASRLIDSRLFGVAPQDPITLLAAIGVLLSVALSAAYLPALRASRVDPMAALRQE